MSKKSSSSSGGGTPLPALPPTTTTTSTDTMNQRSTPTQLAIAGAFGGVAEALVVQPLDMIKTRFQLSAVNNPSIISAMRSVVAEGGVLRFYRGILPELTGMVPKTSAMYASNDWAKRILADQRANQLGIATSSSQNSEVTTSIAALAGGFSGLPEAITVTPFQVVKVRMQAREHLGRYANSLDCVRQVVRDEGVRALTIGFGPTCFRNVVWNTVYFGTMHQVKDFIPKASTPIGDLTVTLLAGTVGGVFATCFNAPFDVVKSRFQRQLPLELMPVGADGVRATQLKYRYTLPSLVTIAREEGVRALYKGFAPKCWRMGLGGGVTMVTFEAALYIMKTKS